MTLAEKVDRWIADANDRIAQRIDRRAQHAKGEISDETLHRSLGQLNRDRDAEAREAQIRG